MKKVYRDTHPLAINFKKLQKYKLNEVKIDEITFFEWLIIKHKSMGEREQFYYQQHRVLEEIGLRPARFRAIRKKFQELGLDYEVKGDKNIAHYGLTQEFIESAVNEFVRVEFRNATIKQILELKVRHHRELSKKEEQRVEGLISELKKHYHIRVREAIRNPHKADIELTIPHNDKTIYQLSVLMKRYSDSAIVDSFIAYTDGVIEGDQNPKHVLNNFTTYNTETNSFPVFDHYTYAFSMHYMETPF